MERDFLGLNSKEPLPVVKEETNSDGYKDIGFNKSSGIHWPFSDKVSALPHLMSFKGSQEDKIKRLVSDSSVSPGFLSISAPDAFDSAQKQFPEFQKSFNHERQGGNHFTLASYPLQHEAQSANHHPHGAKVFPVFNYTSSGFMTHPFFMNHHAITGHNTVSATAKPQLLGGIPVATQQAILPAIGSANRIADWSGKFPGSSAQLTIFYGGTVNVYEDVSPEEAQAVMLLAGNGSSISSNMTQPKMQALAPSSKLVAMDISPVNQHVTTPPCSRLSSPLSVSSHTGPQSGSGSTSTEEILAVKTMGVVTTPATKLDTSKLASAITSVAATTMIPSVPQARKASLARFLEKRKERMMSVAPYNFSSKSADPPFQIQQTDY